MDLLYHTRSADFLYVRIAVKKYMSGTLYIKDYEKTMKHKPL